MQSVKIVLTLLLSTVTYLIGGFDMALQTMTVMIIIDYITGIMKAVNNKNLSSYLGWKGIMKKTSMFLSIIVACQLERAIGQEGLIRNVVAYGFVVNEGISILENMDDLGIQIPLLREYLLRMKDKR